MERCEYVVTLHNKDDLESFYEDMETAGGTLYIPGRAVPVKERRPLSRNTHYMLTADEAEQLKGDSRVMHINLSIDELGWKISKKWTNSQTSSFWNKSNTVAPGQRNWGLLRCINRAQIANWGTNGTTNQTATIDTTSSGKNVDVVIVDGHIDPDHPEFAVNPSGSGGSRVVQYNWFDLTPQVTGGAAGTYVYSPYVDPTYADSNEDGISDRTDDNDHGCHVAGTVAGNRQGWARDANIYNISPYSTAPTYTSNFIDYIRAWHATKEINPITGLRNPTITNHSYGISTEIDITTITEIRYNGNTYSGPFSASTLINYGVYVSGTTAYIPLRYQPLEQDLIDAMNDGIIVVGAAGNEYTKVSNFSVDLSDSYNNYVSDGGFDYYYNRGSITAAAGVICVGAIGSTVAETKIDYSNCGPRVDLYAPGRLIMSSVQSTTGVYSADNRNSSFYNTKQSGTSMASPQVAGVLACLAEQWPTMKQAQALAYLHQHCTYDQITDTGGGSADYTDIQGSTNRYLAYFKDRPDQGQVGPKINQGARPTSGQTWPRPKIYRYGHG
jgi:hypothetical protein